MSINTHYPRIIAWLFVSLQGVLVWQGNEMVTSIKDLTKAASNTQVQIASHEERIKGVEKDQQELAKNNGMAIQTLANETRDLDRRVSKLETTQ